jgi:hypothetical protein
MKKVLTLLSFAGLLVVAGNSCKKEPVSLYASIYGTIIDKVTQEPLSGVTVTLSGVNNENKVTGSDGCYKFANLKTGTYSITVEASGIGYKGDRSSGTLDKEQMERNFQLEKIK